MSAISYRAIKVFKVAREHRPSSPVDADDTAKLPDLPGQYVRWNQLTKETVVQTMLYTTGFLLTYAPMLVYRHFFRHKGSTPKIVLLIVQTLFPLGGFFNILIYTRGAVLSFRREHPEYLWCQAFYEVFKAGGEVPKHGSQLPGRNVVLAPMRNQSVPYGEPAREPAREPTRLSFIGSSNIVGNGVSNSMNESNCAYRTEKEWYYVPGSSERKEIDEPEETSCVFPISSLDAHEKSTSSLTTGNLQWDGD